MPDRSNEQPPPDVDAHVDPVDSVDPAAPSDPGVREQLLLAAIEAATIHGLARLSVVDVAKRAGLSRQTLYRHFPSKEALIAAAVVRETDQLVATVVAAGARHDDPRDALEASLLTALRATREHPLLDRLVRTEPETLLPLLITDGGPVTTRVREVVEALIVEWLPQLEPVLLRRIADLVTRLLVSYAVSAPDDPPEVTAAAIADLVVGGIAAQLERPTSHPDHLGGPTS